VDYDRFETELKTACSKARRIYVKGWMKKDFMSRLVDSEVIDLGDRGAPSINKLVEGSIYYDRSPSVLRCIRHCAEKEYRCALTVADRLRHWYESNDVFV